MLSTFGLADQELWGESPPSLGIGSVIQVDTWRLP
jgi:hypothetical protein